MEKQPRAEKVAVVSEVRELLTQSDAAFITEYRGLSVKGIAELRGQLRPNGTQYKVYKNTLVRRAAAEVGIEGLDSLLVGPVAIAFVKGDAAATAKILRDAAKTNPILVVKGGVLGNKVLSTKETAALADLPSREQLLAQLAGAMQAPMSQFASLLNAVPQKMAYALQALIDQKNQAA
jgi:large subunit ribosomal protein L10